MDRESILVEQLRENISDIIPDHPQFNEGFYLRFWLRAGKYDIIKTEALIREEIKWRKDNDTDKATESEYHPEVHKSFHVTFDGKTKSGFSVWTAPAGRFRFGETISKYGKEAVLYYWLQLACKAEKQLIERNREARKLHGDCVSTWTPSQKSWLLLDMEHLQYGDLLNRDVISVMVSLVKMCVTHFPSLEGNFVFLNAGRIMEFFFKLIRPMLTGTNLGMLVFGTNKAKWKPAILEYIDQDQIATIYGGTLDVATLD
jgi:hypothetical protein